MKKFVKKTEGFTLVELIVVIAILGILAGVGTVGYSGYIKKANMSADINLVNEVEHALTLAGYAGTIGAGDSGCIWLFHDAEVQGVGAGSNLEKALIATFGPDYKGILKLAYNEWGSNGLYDNLTPESAFAVKGSSYMSGNRKDDLLKDVETLTGMAQNLVVILGEAGVAEGTTLSNMFGEAVLNETASKYGITLENGQTWDEWGAENETAYGNLLVMTAADEAEKYMSTMGQDNEYEMSAASTLILQFSSLYAYAAMDEEFSATMDNYMAHLNKTGTVEGLSPVTNAATGASWYNSLVQQAGDGYTAYMNTANVEGGQAVMDQVGFLSILSGIGNPSEDQADRIAAELDNANLFTSGVVNDMYNDYLGGVDALAGMYDENGDYADWTMGVGSGSVAIMVGQRDGQTVVESSLP